MTFHSSGGRRPSQHDVERFWALVEQAWSHASPEANEARYRLATRTSDDGVFKLMSHVDKALTGVIEFLEDHGQDLTSAGLTDLDRVVERLLFDIDRSDIQQVTDGSDDGFLYARGFIVALGQHYYEAVVSNPSLAVLDCDCEEMCHLFADVHEELFGKRPDTGSGITRESCTNPAGWYITWAAR
ncbi:DUF4240 domain-containing protein [Catelliglobosispora koreensis]|uniref:DUF4240 domain-containing protein n=1 Tax=Catelliglobosispora koreensis TaxID=129052 RepID=UPI000363FA51|nr:DUF4240 domain-containing protein [Catelliglobosispora koreensis]